MPITFRSASTRGAELATDLTGVGRPAGTTNGDFLLAICSLSHDDNATSVSSTGWFSLLNLTDNTSGPRFAVLYKTASSEPSTWTFTKNDGSNSQFIVHVLCFEGVDTSNPIAQSASHREGTANDTTITADSRTTVADSLLVCAFSAESYNQTANSFRFSPPTGMIERSDYGHVYNHLGTNTQHYDVATTTGTRTSTFSTGSNDGTGAISFVLRAAISAFPPTVDAGANVGVDQHSVFDRVALEDDGGATITSRAWTVQAGPAYVGSTISTSATLAWEPETPGEYTLRYTATNDMGSGSDDVLVTVYEVYHPQFINLFLHGDGPGGPNYTGGPLPSDPLILSGTRIGVKNHDATLTAPFVLSGSAAGLRINVAEAHLVLKAKLTAWSRPGQGSAEAVLRLAASRTGTSDRSAPATADLVVAATSEATKDVPVATLAEIVLAAPHTAYKDVSGLFLAPVVLAAITSNLSHDSYTARTALVRLSGSTSELFTTRGDAQLGRLYLHAVPTTTSLRFNHDYEGHFRLHGTMFGFRVEIALTDAVATRADTKTKYELVCVARIPQSSGPPLLLEMDPIDWTGLSIVEELNKPSGLTVQAKFTRITDEVLNRLRSPDELATELWLNRNGKRVFSGPLLGVNASGDSLTLEARDILAYTDMWIIENDLAYKDREQFEIVADLINLWQSSSFGNFGLITSDIPPSGILRSQNYLKKEMTHVFKAVDDMGKMSDGFDFGVDPVSRRLELYYPFRGQDRSSGEDAIVFDSRNVSSDTVTFSVGPLDLASDSFGSAGQTDDAVLYASWHNDELRTRYGRTAYGSTYSSAKDQETLDSYTRAAGEARSQTLYIPGPNTRVTLDADINNYEVGDFVSYTMHNQLNALGSFRIRKRTIGVDGTGKENVSVEFV